MNTKSTIAFNESTFDVFYGFKHTSDYLKKTKENTELVTLPKRKTEGSAGYDIHCPYPVVINPGETVKIYTGVKSNFPSSFVLHLYVRSSTAIKKNLILKNQVGIIDSDYYNNPDNEGEIIVALKNIGDKPYEIKKNEAIVQGILIPYGVLIDYDKKQNSGVEKRQGGIGSTDN